MVILGCLIFGLLAIAVWRGSSELLSPTRRTLQPYHRKFLDRPADYGISLEKFIALDGKVPCLLIRPDAGAGVSGRGKVIRRQLEERGWVLPPFGETVGNVVLLHGHRGRKEDLIAVAERFCAVGFRCLIPDLPGNGDSPMRIGRFGTSDFEAGLPQSLLEETARRFQFPPSPAGLWGMSMGGAYVARAAAQPEAPWQALVVVSSFDTLEEVVNRKIESYVGLAAPLVWRSVGEACLWRGGVDLALVRPVRWAAEVRAPVMVVHGDADALILSSQGNVLFQAYGSAEKSWVLVKGGDHNRVLVTEQPVFADMASWYLQHLGGGKAPETALRRPSRNSRS